VPLDNRLSSVRRRIETIELLALAKRFHTYRELSQVTGLPITVLSRYAKGHVMPSSNRTEELRKVLFPMVSLEKLLVESVEFDSDGYLNNSRVVWDPGILRLAAYRAMDLFAGRKITKILTAAVDGVPFATILAGEMEKGLVVAKTSREVAISDFIEESFIPSSSAVVTTLYVPKYSIRREDSVLIVDDVARSGDTQRAMINLTLKAKASVAGILTLIGIGDHWKEKPPWAPDIQIHAIVGLSEPPPKPLPATPSQRAP